MPELEELQEKVQDKLPSGAATTALKAAAAAAATGAATYAMKRAFSHEGNGSSSGPSLPTPSALKKKRSGGAAILASAATTGWEAASDVIVPLAEDAAESAGKYVATHGPEILRERIIPKFIEAFEDAK